jgi:hypothetical protein
MNKLEKGKLQEIEIALYGLNLFIGTNFISKKLEAEFDDWIKISDELARSIRQLRSLQ